MLRFLSKGVHGVRLIAGSKLAVGVTVSLKVVILCALAQRQTDNLSTVDPVTAGVGLGSPVTLNWIRLIYSKLTHADRFC